MAVLFFLGTTQNREGLGEGGGGGEREREASRQANRQTVTERVRVVEWVDD